MPVMFAFFFFSLSCLLVTCAIEMCIKKRNFDHFCCCVCISLWTQTYVSARFLASLLVVFLFCFRLTELLRGYNLLVLLTWCSLHKSFNELQKNNFRRRPLWSWYHTLFTFVFWGWIRRLINSTWMDPWSCFYVFWALVNTSFTFSPSQFWDFPLRVSSLYFYTCFLVLPADCPLNWRKRVCHRGERAACVYSLFTSLNAEH